MDSSGIGLLAVSSKIAVANARGESRRNDKRRVDLSERPIHHARREMIRSFDIFDTCLTRRVAEPAGVFDCMAERLGLGRHFRFIRQEAEREAMRRHGDATLDEIYGILADWSEWSDTRRNEVMAAELDEESRQLIPVPEILEEVRECRRKGDTVVFLSDMYLPSAFLVERLREHGFHEEGDVLMVSCEHRKSKASGQLFKEAGRLLGTAQWEHRGNHIHADVRGAERAGLQGTYFPNANLSPHESQLLGWKKEGVHIGAAWAGAARQARIALGRLNNYEHEIAAVSAGVAAPLLLTYVTWLARRAAFHGIERLYFLARDGQILRNLFIRIAKAEGLAIEARYLHASRIALRFPRRFPMNDEDTAGVFQANDSAPISVVALRLGIPEQDLMKLLPANCRPGGGIPKHMVASCRKMLASVEACEILNPVAEERSRLLEAYLRQEGLMDGCKCGLVDLGWGGSLQAGIQKALDGAACPAKPLGFYLGLGRLSSNDLSAEAFAFDYRRGDTPDVAWFSTLAELFSQADHGSTIGFQSTVQGNIAPLLDERDSDNPRVPNWLELHQSAVHGFADAVIAADALTDSPNSLVRLLRGHLRRFYFFPSKAEAATWGACRFSSHGAASIREPLAPLPRSITDLLWTMGIRRFGVGKAIWPHGAAARCPAPLNHLARLFHRLLNRIRPPRW